MADDANAVDLKKKRTFRKFTYRGVDLDQLFSCSLDVLYGGVGIINCNS
jgi:hypothetical protein